MSEVERVFVLPSNGLEDLEFVRSVGDGVYMFAPTDKVFFYDKTKYEGPSDPKLAEEVGGIVEALDRAAKLPPELQDELAALALIPDSEIDMTADDDI